MASSTPTEPGNAVPLLIGITGHRDPIPDDLPKLKQAVTTEIEKIRSLSDNTDISLISALAEGADRLAAKVALEMGLQLLAVLPMPRAEYEKDFTDPQSLAEFRGLLQQATHVIELPLLDKQLQAVDSMTEVDRVLQYEHLGLFLASHCHVLIALWDGNEIAKRGGTDDVVSMRKGCPGPANPTVFYSRSALPIGYGIQIVTPRQSREDVQGKPYSRSPIIPDSWKYSDQTEEKEINERAEKMLAKIVSNTQALNSDMRDQVNKHRKSVERSRGYLAENQKTLPEDESVQQLIDYYSVVDSLAIRLKRYRVRAITALFALIVSAFIWFELHVKVFPYLEWLPSCIPPIGYLLLISPIVIVFLCAKRGRFDEKHEDYRVLAEALRVQIFWRLSGMTDAVINHCIPRQVGELSWIRLALFGLTYPLVNRPGLADPDIEYVRTEWVEGQANWYADHVTTQSKAVEQNTGRGRTLLITCALIAFALCLLLAAPHSEIQDMQFWLIRGLIMLVAALLAFAAASHGYTEMLALAEQTHQYDRMKNVFGLANKTLVQLKDTGSTEDIKQVMLRLGEEALAEHGDWLIMHRARPLEVPRL